MDKDVQQKLASYPTAARQQIENVRKIVFEIAAQEDLGEVQESLKWGEASYRVAGGSTVRIDWKAEDPDVINLFFHCQTRLIETFRTLYPHAFSYEENRTLQIPVNAATDSETLRHCIRLALEYLSVKYLPLLGAQR